MFLGPALGLLLTAQSLRVLSPLLTMDLLPPPDVKLLPLAVVLPRRQLRGEQLLQAMVATAGTMEDLE